LVQWDIRTPRSDRDGVWYPGMEDAIQHWRDAALPDRDLALIPAVDWFHNWNDLGSGDLGRLDAKRGSCAVYHAGLLYHCWGLLGDGVLLSTKPA
jgi:hypothetical protein